MTDVQSHNYVMGYALNEHGVLWGDLVCSQDGGTKLTVDHSRPMTLDRCAVIMISARAMSARPLTKISIHLYTSAKAPGDLDSDPTIVLADWRWDYDPASLSVVAYCRGRWIYTDNANDGFNIRASLLADIVADAYDGETEVSDLEINYTAKTFKDWAALRRDWSVAGEWLETMLGGVPAVKITGACIHSADDLPPRNFIIADLGDLRAMIL